jgi:MOSC domain-containing protein YiiM
MRMHLISVNLAAAPAKLEIGSRTTSTGIYKRPTRAAVAIGTLGLSGDTIWSKKHHGGPDQAVYVYGEDDYAWWSAELGRALEPGTFGENLTVAGLATRAAMVGDRLHVGAAVVLEVTCGRIPCGTLTARMGIRAFSRRFREAARPGLYCRVIEVGDVRTGDPVRYAPAAGPTIGIVELGEMFYARDLTPEQLELALAAPIDERGRQGMELQLAALRSP